MLTKSRLGSRDQPTMVLYKGVIRGVSLEAQMLQVPLADSVNPMQLRWTEFQMEKQESLILALVPQVSTIAFLISYLNSLPLDFSHIK